MNRVRRKRISNVIKTLEQSREEVEDILGVEEAHYDNIPENLQDSQIAENSQNAIDNLNEAIDNLNEAINNLEEAQG